MWLCLKITTLRKQLRQREQCLEKSNLLKPWLWTYLQQRKISISDVYASQSPIFCCAVLSWWNKEMREKRKSDLQAAFYQFYLFLLTLRLLNSAHLGDAYGNSPLWLRVCWGLLVFLTASLNLFKYSDVQCAQVYNSLINFASHNCIIFLFILLMCLFRLVFFLSVPLIMV